MPITITTAAIAKFIGAGLAAAGWNAIEENALKPGVQPVTEGLRVFVGRRYKQRKADRAMQAAVRQAFDAIGAP